MAAKTVNQEDVFNAARELVAAGEKPSILAIHKRLGRGSNTTIAKYRTQFLESDEMKDLQVANLPPVAELPKEFEEEGSHFVKKIWQMAKSVSDAQLEAEREALSAKHEAMQQEVTEAVDFSDSVANERDEYQEKSEAQALVIEQSKSEITELKHALEMAEQKITGLTTDLERASIDAVEVKEKLASSIRDTASLKQETIGLNSRLSETKDAHQIEISRLLEQAESEKNRIIKQSEKSLEKVETQHTATITDLKTAHHKAVNQLIEQHNKSQGQLEDVMSDIRQQRDQFQKEAADLRAEAAKKKKTTKPSKPS
jgi:chromosome segregation ATPase